MKRNMDLIRLILIKIAEAETFDKPLDIIINDYETQIINYHLKLLRQAGLIDVFNNKPINNFGSVTQYFPVCLTWEGQEFLEATKNSTIWNKTLNLIKEKGVGITFEVVKGLLLQETLKITGLK